MTTPDMGGLTPEVRQAIDEIAAAFPDATVSVDADGEGGAYVSVRDVALAPIYRQRETWIGFHITYTYPAADVYPHFVREDLCRADGSPLGNGMSPRNFRSRPAIQLSRRSNRRNPVTDTAALKLQKVLRWLNDRP